MLEDFMFGWKIDGELKLTGRDEGFIIHGNDKIDSIVGNTLRAIKKIKGDKIKRLRNILLNVEDVTNRWKRIEDIIKYVTVKNETESWFCTTEDYSADLKDYINGKADKIRPRNDVMVTSGFMDEIEFIVLLNLDTERLEVYRGRQDNPEDNHLGNFTNRDIILRKHNVSYNWSIYKNSYCKGGQYISFLYAYKLRSMCLDLRKNIKAKA
jgi:hypothetical protein